MPKWTTKLKDFALRVLALDDTELPKEQFDFIRDCSQKMMRFEIQPDELKDLMKFVQAKHAVDAILVTNENGSTLASSDGHSVKQALNKTALFNYINSELPNSETVMIRSEKTWHVLFKFEDKIFIINAASRLNRAELQAISREVQGFLERKPLPKAEVGVEAN
jgi:hypothetical protein